MQAFVRGQVWNVKTATSQAGNPYFTVTLLDEDGTLELFADQPVYASASELVKQAVIAELAITAQQRGVGCRLVSIRKDDGKS